MAITILEVPLAVVELPQLPLLLLLKLHTYIIIVVRGLLLLLFVMVCRMTQFVAAVVHCN